MMDPLSITASVVGITTEALQSAQFLAKTIEDVRDPRAPLQISAPIFVQSKLYCTIWIMHYKVIPRKSF
jgi:hypothetical protein